MESNQIGGASNNGAKILIAVVAAVVVIGALYGWMQKRDTGSVVVSPTMEPTVSVVATVTPITTLTATPTVTRSPATPPKTVSFTVVGKNYSFAPNQIRVKKGDTVKITFQNQDGIHNFILDEFNAKTSIVQSGQSLTVEFVAGTAGQFQYYCSVGNHRAMGMWGTLVVE